MMMENDRATWCTNNATQSETTRALVNHLLHECIEARSQIQGVRRLVSFLEHHSKRSEELGIKVSLDVGERAVAEAVATIADWLHAQVVALHDPGLTTQLMKGTPPRTGD